MQPRRLPKTTSAKLNEQLDPRLRAWLERALLAELGAGQAHELQVAGVGTSPRVLRCTLFDGPREIAGFILKVAPRDARSNDPMLHEIRMHRLVYAHFALLGGAQGVPEPLAARETTPPALALEVVLGTELASLLKVAAIGSQARLRAACRGLEQVASLLATLHAMPPAGVPPRRPAPAEYARRLLRQAVEVGVVSRAEYGALRQALEGRLPALEARPMRVVHGDANATNFMLTGAGAMAIDLERVGLYDPALDLGFLAAEVRHLVAQYGGSGARSRQLLQALFGSYQQCADFRLESYHGVYLAMGLWRVARNVWIPHAHRRRLVALSRLALSDGPKRFA